MSDTEHLLMELYALAQAQCEGTLDDERHSRLDALILGDRRCAAATCSICRHTRQPSRIWLTARKARPYRLTQLATSWTILCNPRTRRRALRPCSRADSAAHRDAIRRLSGPFPELWRRHSRCRGSYVAGRGVVYVHDVGSDSPRDPRHPGTCRWSECGESSANATRPLAGKGQGARAVLAVSPVARLNRMADCVWADEATAPD